MAAETTDAGASTSDLFPQPPSDPDAPGNGDSASAAMTDVP